MQMQSLERRRESKGNGSSSSEELMGSKSTTFPYSPPLSKRSRSYGKLLLMALAAAALCFLVYHRQREKRVLSILLEEHEQELHSLHALLQKEKEKSEEMKKKIEEMKEAAISLRSQKTELGQKLAETQNMAGYLKKRQSEMQLEQDESQRKIRVLKGMESDFAKARNQIKLLKSLLERQGQKYELLKHRLEFLSTKQENATDVGSSDMNVSGTLPSNMTEPVEGHIEKAKLALNETKDLTDGEKHEEVVKEADDVRIDADSHSGVIKENITKEFGGQGLTLESQAQTSNQTGGEEHQNATYIEPEIMGGTHRGAKLQVMDEVKDQANGIGTTGEHVNPIRPKHRRHKMLARNRRASGISSSTSDGRSLEDNHRLPWKRSGTGLPSVLQIVGTT